MNGPEEGVQSREERIEALAEESARTLAEWFVDAEDERDGRRAASEADISAGDDRYVTALVERDRLTAELEATQAANRELHASLCDLVDHTDATCTVVAGRDRYRSAWLSARRRAAKEAEFAAEALALKDAEIAYLADG